MSLCFHGLPAYLTLFVGPAVGVWEHSSADPVPRRPQQLPGLSSAHCSSRSSLTADYVTRRIARCRAPHRPHLIIYTLRLYVIAEIIQNLERKRILIALLEYSVVASFRPISPLLVWSTTRVLGELKADFGISGEIFIYYCFRFDPPSSFFTVRGNSKTNYDLGKCKLGLY